MTSGWRPSQRVQRCGHEHDCLGALQCSTRVVALSVIARTRRARRWHERFRRLGTQELRRRFAERIPAQQAGAMYVHSPVIAGQSRPVGTLTADKTRAVQDIRMRVERVADLARVLAPIASKLVIPDFFVLNPSRRPCRRGGATRADHVADPCHNVRCGATHTLHIPRL